ncbi:MAG TPA: glycosyltransferase family 39 protein, partial [Elusimicrobiales bacterium]|nr:glycosyltransferase family 39 protein [Elusimicrobiales bacterium]
YYYSNLNIKNRELEKRPLLFPFLAHVVHLVLGYKWTNLFVLNFIVAWTFLFLFYRVFEPHVGPPGGMAAGLLLASYPIFSLNATGGGYDLLSALFLSLSVLMMWVYLRHPECEELDLLWCTLLMLANVRYETLLYGAVICAVLLVFKRVHDKKRLLTLALWSVPFLLPMVWQRLLTLGGYEQPAGTALFRLSSFLENLRAFVLGQINFGLPFNNLCNIAAIVLFEWVLMSFIWRKHDDRAALPLTVAISAITGINLLVCFAHFFVPAYTHATSARLFLPFVAASAFAVAAFFAKIVKVRGIAQLAAAVLLFALYHPIAMERRFSSSLTLVHTTDQVYEQLAAYGNKNILIIVDRPGLYTVMNYGAVTFKYANNNAIDILTSFRKRMFGDIIVIQEILYKGDIPKQGDKLLPCYTLQTLWEIQNSSTTMLRISRVTEDALPPSGDGAL